MTQPIESPVVVLVPVYNDWTAAAAMLPSLERALADAGIQTEVVLVNDGSTEPFNPAKFAGMGKAITRLWRLDLRRNLGHQRAIAVGLIHLYMNARFEAVVVMDSDGEDDPADVPRLIERFRSGGGQRVIFAERTRRSEGLVFSLFYWAYRVAHHALTGVRVRMGNFSVLPRRAVDALVLVPDLWNHFPASIYKAKLPFEMVPTHRARRLSGRSSMNFVGLVVHGLSSMSVFGEVVGVRLLIATMVLALVLAPLLAGALLGRLPAWAPLAVAVTLILAAQLTTLSLFFVFGSLGGRQGASFIPQREGPIFIAGCEEVPLRSA